MVLEMRTVHVRRILAQDEKIHVSLVISAPALRCLCLEHGPLLRGHSWRAPALPRGDWRGEPHRYAVHVVKVRDKGCVTSRHHVDIVQLDPAARHGVRAVEDDSMCAVAGAGDVFVVDVEYGEGLGARLKGALSL